MIKSKWLNLLKFSVFNFGNQKVTQFILFECKYLFSIIFFYFHKSDDVQDRFHTHAFNAMSILLWGNYVEEFLNENKKIYSKFRNRSRFLFIPRDKYHRITRSLGCATVLLSGPWKKEWKEFKDNKEIIYTWNRKINERTN